MKTKVTKTAKWFLPFYFFAFSLLNATAQLPAGDEEPEWQERPHRGDCTPGLNDGSTAEARGMKPRRLPAINTNWDPNKTYHQLVVLFSFTDKNFKESDPKAFFNSLFNEEGFQQRNGNGCMAEYFREQSGGKFNMQFDIYGPYQVNSKAQPYDNPTKSTKNYGKEVMFEATNMMIAENPDLDFSLYDWNGDKEIEQIIYVYAGISGNQGEPSYGHIWPNTSYFSQITTSNGYVIKNYTCSGELWANGNSCGIGTICHEFSHSLGLPDIYPTNGWIFSAVDEWDLMDGGNFSNFGSCPPNYSPLEKMLMGWLQPIELTEPTTIEGLKPVTQGGEVYIVKHTANEYLLLENRQWEGWDAALPGRGLVAYHVNYSSSKWSSNNVNTTQNALNYSILCADNMDYDDWDELLVVRGVNSAYQTKNRMHSWYFSSAPYPWSTDSTDVVNNQLTDVSVPATTMYNQNSRGSKSLGKPITNISMNDAGLVSFDFIGGESTAVKGVSETYTCGMDKDNFATFDLSGRRVASQKRHTLCVIRREDGSVQKVFK